VRSPSGSDKPLAASDAPALVAAVFEKRCKECSNPALVKNYGFCAEHRNPTSGERSSKRQKNVHSRPGSQHRGVSWHHASGKWEAQIIRGDGKTQHLGFFETESEAAATYTEAEVLDTNAAAQPAALPTHPEEMACPDEKTSKSSSRKHSAKRQKASAGPRTSTEELSTTAEFAGKQTRERFAFYRTQNNDTPALIAQQQNLDLKHFLKINKAIYAELKGTSKLKADTYLMYDTSDHWTEGVIISDDKYLEENGLWRVRYGGSPDNVTFDMTWDQARAACWQWQIAHENWEIAFSSSNPYIGARGRTVSGMACTVVGCFPLGDIDDAGERLWKVHHNDFDGK
jgi:hypothetical protein